MTVVATPLPQRLLGPPEPFPGCSAFDDPKPPTCSCPVMGEAEKRDCAVPMRRYLTGFGLPEYDQRRLRWMNAPAKAGKPLWSYAHDLLSVRFQLTADDKVISKTGQEASSLQPGLDLVLEPFLQHVLEEYIGKYG
jgi:hypothetical protein